MTDEISETHALLSMPYASVVLPAGCGKTELLAKLVARMGGFQLVLTHTHAGVRAIRKRLARIGVSPENCRVETIAAWALEYASKHVVISGYESGDSEAGHWSAIYRGATKVVLRPIGRMIVSKSYTGVLVDEYQDCSVEQHALIVALAKCLPCRVVGDPLQAIFGFRNEELIDWGSVQSEFPNCEQALHPWRWNDANVALGRWLLDIRSTLEREQSINIPSNLDGLQWTEDTFENRLRVCFRALNHGEDSVLVLGHMPATCHQLSRSIGRVFTSMDERERKDLLAWATQVEQASPIERIARLGNVAQKCITNLPAALKQDLKRIGSGAALARLRGDDPARQALRCAIEDPDAGSLGRMYQVFGAAGRHIFRRDLWFDVGRAIRIWEEGKCAGILDATRMLLRSRIHGEAPISKRVISRTLLVKGLEFDHVVIIGADDLDAENLYVAMSRAQKSVTVLSKARNLSPKLSRSSPR